MCRRAALGNPGQTRPKQVRRKNISVQLIACVWIAPNADIWVLAECPSMRRLTLKFALALAVVPGVASCVAIPVSQMAVTIPAQFHGKWDANAAACAAPVSDMRQYIGADGMRFGDAVGTARRVIKRDIRSATILTSFLSDGDPWEGKVRLSLSPMGEQLTMQANGTSTIRQRCALSG
jgi:hypothetical protein